MREHDLVTIFLVEDERIIRERLCTMLDWEKYGFQLIGAAADGELALPSVLQSKPDILMTDIKMPFIDGLQLVEQVKQVLPETECILLSGHQDFEYARRAIEMKVSHYILKPVTSHDLLMMLWKTKQRILEKRQPKSEAGQSSHWDQHYFIQALLRGEYTNTSDILKRAGEVNLDILSNCYQVGLIERQSGEPLGEEPLTKRYTLCEGLAASLIYQLTDKTLAVILRATSEEELRQQLQSLRDCVQRINLEATEADKLSLDEGSQVKRLTELPQSYQEAWSKREKRMHATAAADPAEADSRQQEEKLVVPLESSGLAKDALEGILRDKDEAWVREHLREDFPMSEKSYQSLIYRAYLVTDICRYLAGWCTQRNLEIPAGLTRADEIEKFALFSTGVEDFYGFLQEHLSEIIRLRGPVEQSDQSKYVQQACALIEKEYADPDLNLSTVAEAVHLSPSYLSTLFNSELKSSFSDYVNLLRLKKAKVLLLQTDRKSQDICYEVGLANPAYFSALFKKYFGMTPSQYRLSRGEHEQ